MKTFLSSSIISIIVSYRLLSSVSAEPSSHANVPETARGIYKKFDIDDNGNADIELYDGGPSMQCKMKNVRGKGGGKYCTSDLKSVTLTDAPCQSQSNGSKNIFPFRGDGVGSNVTVTTAL